MIFLPMTLTACNRRFFPRQCSLNDIFLFGLPVFSTKEIPDEIACAFDTDFYTCCTCLVHVLQYL